MKKTLIVVVLTSALAISACNSGSSSTPPISPIDNAQYYGNLCAAESGYFQYGIINSPPSSDYPNVVNYAAATESIQTIPLSHTHIEITSAVDGKIYNVAIDNVFAANYNPFSESIPATYSANLTAGSMIYMCSGNPSGVPYSVSGTFAQQGFDWVHTNCVASGYASTYKNGFLFTSNNQNLTNGQTYCYLWPN
jgi:hypothetical protein